MKRVFVLKEERGEKGSNNTFDDGSVEAEGSFPPSFLETIKALNTLRNFSQDLTIYRCSWIWYPVQNPRKKEKKMVLVLLQTKDIYYIMTLQN